MIWLRLCIIIYSILFWRLFIVTDGGKIRTMYRRPGQSDDDNLQGRRKV